MSLSERLFWVSLTSASLCLRPLCSYLLLLASYIWGPRTVTSLSAFQYSHIVAWQLATSIEPGQYLLLLSHFHGMQRTPQIENTRSHRQVLTEWFWISIHIKHSQRKKNAALDEILPRKIEERNAILQRREHIGNQG